MNSRLVESLVASSSDVLLSKETPVGSNEHVYHVVKTHILKGGYLPIPDIFSLTRNQLSIVLHAFRAQLEEYRNAESKNKWNINRLSSEYMFYLTLYLVANDIDNERIKVILNNWNAKIIKNDIFINPKFEELKKFRAVANGYDVLMEGLIVSPEEFSGKKYKDMCLQDYIDYATIIWSNMQNYQKLKNLTHFTKRKLG
jgi:hypothetical protein